MKNNLKHYRLSVSRVFPVSHPRKGEETYFDKKILLTLMRNENKDLSIKAISQGGELSPKLHTIRANYPLWENRMKEVQEGRAVIELFYWSDKPYRSKQIVFATLDKDSGCGIQKIFFSRSIEFPRIMNGEASRLALMPSNLTKNDGLSLEDFKAWFKNYDLSEPLAIIQFTKFRY